MLLNLELYLGITFIKGKRSEWTSILEAKNRILEDCSHFGIKEPSFPKLEEIDADLSKHEEMSFSLS